MRFSLKNNASGLRMYFLYILSAALIVLCLTSCAGAGGKKAGGGASPELGKPDGAAASQKEELETGEEEVSDPDAYSNFQQHTSTSGNETRTLGGGLMAQYGYESSYVTGREEKDGQVRSYLTGRWVDKKIGMRRPIAVMLNNIKDAQPMSGVSMADVLYECVVEGALTRMMGIFENYDNLDKIGSVRSCRNYFVYYALEFDAIYCHYGQSAYAKPLLDLEYVDNLSGLAKEGDTVYYRTTDRIAPHNAYASARGIKKGIEMMGYDETYSPDYKGKFTFAPDSMHVTLEEFDDSFEAKRVEPGYMINKPWFEYNEEDHKYYRFQYDGPQIDAENDEQLCVDNIILQYSPWEQVDEKGYLGFDCHGGGRAVYITNGRAIEAVWLRFDGDTGSTRYFDRYQNEIVMNQGKTWICIIQDTMSDHVVIS